MLQSGINQLGTNIIVAHTAARKVFEIWGLPVSVLGSSMATYCGQNYGAGRYDRIRQGMKSVLILGAAWVKKWYAATVRERFKDVQMRNRTTKRKIPVFLTKPD